MKDGLSSHCLACDWEGSRQGALLLNKKLVTPVIFLYSVTNIEA
jgi:hypothetical protein